MKLIVKIIKVTFPAPLLTNNESINIHRRVKVPLLHNKVSLLHNKISFITKIMIEDEQPCWIYIPVTVLLFYKILRSHDLLQ